MRFGRIHHVSINVAAIEPAVRFYTGVLGMGELQRPEFPFAGAWLDAGEQQIHLIEVEGFEPPRGQHFALEVDDLDATIAELRASGVEVSEPTAVADVCRQAFLSDPTGNLIELNEPSHAPSR